MKDVVPIDDTLDYELVRWQAYFDDTIYTVSLVTLVSSSLVKVGCLFFNSVKK